MADHLDEMFTPETALVEPEPEVSPEPAPVAEPAPAEPAAEVVAPTQPQETPIAPERPEPGFVPIAAMMDEREKRKALEAQVAQYQSQQRAPQVPDAYDDPEGYAAHMRAEFAGQLQQQKVDTSWTLAVRDHGQEATEAAKQWAIQKAQGDPIFSQQLDVAFATQTLPIDWLVQQHKRDALLSDIGDRSMDDFVRDYVTKNPSLLSQSAPVPAAAPVVATTQQASPPVRVPRSLASQGSGPSDVRETATGPLAGVDALFI